MKVLIIGISVRSMAGSAFKSGYSVVALDAFGDQDLKTMAEAYSLRRDFHTVYSPDNLFKASRDLAFDAVAYTSNLENYPEVIARFSKSHRIFGNTHQTVSSVRRWPELFEKLRRAGFSVPETVFAGEPLPSDSKNLWLKKPLLSGGGHGIRYCRPKAESPVGNEGTFKTEGCMLQQYIPGRPCSAAFVANGKNSVLLGIAEQWIGMTTLGARDFQYCGNLLPIPEMCNPDRGKEILNEIRRLTDFLSGEFGLCGVNGIDFVLCDGRVYLTEVNPRYSASMEIIEIAYGLPIFQMHVQSILNSRLPEFDLESEISCSRFYGKCYLYAEKDVTMPDTGLWIRKTIRDVPASGERMGKGAPICTILAEGPTRMDTFTVMTRRAEKLREEIYG